MQYLHFRVRPFAGNWFRRWLLGLALLIVCAASPVARGQSVSTLHSFLMSEIGQHPMSGLIQAKDGNFYGTTSAGGGYGNGTVFQITPDGSLTTLYSFTGGSDGSYPQYALLQASDGNLYGATTGGGINFKGTVFKITLNGTLTTLYRFSGGSDGAHPSALIQASDGNLYGVTAGGGINNQGTVFKITLNGTLTALHSFSGGSEGEGPYASLLQARDGNLYGTTSAGIGNSGTVFKITTGGVLTTLHSFNSSDGANPIAPLIQASDGNLYGTTQLGGAGGGTVFKLTTSGTLTTLYGFNSSSDGANPNGLIQANDGALYGTAADQGPNGQGALFKITLAGAFTVLHNFNGNSGSGDGGWPSGVLVQAKDGNLYGTTSSFAYGTVFKITTTGTLTTLYSFNANGYDSDGEQPAAALLQARDGNLYGTTQNGGANNKGTVFRITPTGTFALLYSFNGSDGNSPAAALVQATDGNLYGTTTQGGTDNAGTVFKITTSGGLTTLYSFTGGFDGEHPSTLLQARDGNLYGIAQNAGANNAGTVFKITTSGSLTTLYSFTGGSDGANPNALLQASDGNVYGTTLYGGSLNNNGTVFTITSAGTLTTLRKFVGGSSGTQPNSLIQANDGNLYGTTAGGGTANAGVVFKITTTGKLTTLYSFTGGSDGLNPSALLQASDGNLYGTTPFGGIAYNGIVNGTIFKITPGGTFTSVTSFHGSDGSLPNGLIQASDGNLYGAAWRGGAANEGTVFKLVGVIPTLSTLSPNSLLVGSANTIITLTGANFAASAVAWWGTTSLQTTYVSSTQLTALVPANLLSHSGNFSVTVSNPAPGGGISGALTFTVLDPVPTLTALSPAQAPVGSPDTTITLTGTNFAPNSTAMWGNAPLTTSYVSPTKLTAVLPANLLSAVGVFRISVNSPSPGGGNTSVVNFIVGNPMPTLTSLSPSSVVEGSPVTTVTIHGTGFVAGAKASFGTTNLATTFVSSTQLSVVLPANLLAYPTSANITVTNPTPSLGTSAPLTFTVAQGVTTLALVSNSANQIARVTGGMVVIQALQNTGSYTATGIQITSATLAGTNSVQIVPSSTFNLSKTGIYPLQLKFPAGAAAIGSTPTLTVTYTSTNAGSGTLTFVCGKVH